MQHGDYLLVTRQTHLFQCAVFFNVLLLEEAVGGIARRVGCNMGRQIVPRLAKVILGCSFGELFSRLVWELRNCAVKALEAWMAVRVHGTYHPQRNRL